MHDAAPRALLVTGCYRSGTTLLEKLMHGHPHVCVGSQPFPILYFQVKEAFYREIGLQRRYPLDHLFLEGGYHPDEFYAFLDSYVLSTREVEQLFDGLENYRLGLWMPEILRFRDQIRAGTFLDIYHQLNARIAEVFPKESLLYVGGKEILVEEYVPYLLRAGTSVLLIVRDPRDMITSLNFRERDNLTGAHRPVLYSLRIWRKSVAMAIGCEREPGFYWLRYEDLITAPMEKVNEIASVLQLEPFIEDIFRMGIRDQHGDVWQGNSSFQERAGVSGDAAGRFTRVLPLEVIEYIESCCYPEMRMLGYDFWRSDAFNEAAVQRYRDPFVMGHTKFPRDYSSSTEHVTQEIERHRKLAHDELELSGDEARRWFIHPVAYERLREAVRREEK